MDRHNNPLAIEIGLTARTWDEVEQGAREVIEGSRGDGSDGGAVWLPEAQWSSHPKDDTTGEERPPEFWNWPEIDWNKSVEGNPGYRYPYGGEEHRYQPAIDEPEAILDPTRPVSEITPLSRPVASWSAEDLRRVMASPAYLEPSHPGRARAHAMVRRWFEEAGGAGPGRVDATGRPVREPGTAAAPPGGGCEVPVRDHTREGGKVAGRRALPRPAGRLSRAPAGWAVSGCPPGAGQRPGRAPIIGAGSGERGAVPWRTARAASGSSVSA